MKSVLTLLSALACKGWWQICGRPCRPAAAPPWRRRQRWAAAGLSGELETGTSDWHVPTCEKTPIRSSHNGPRKKKKKKDPSNAGSLCTWSSVWLPEGRRRWQWLTGHCGDWSFSLLRIPALFRTSLSWRGEDTDVNKRPRGRYWRQQLGQNVQRLKDASCFLSINTVQW